MDMLLLEYLCMDMGLRVYVCVHAYSQKGVPVLHASQHTWLCT